MGLFEHRVALITGGTSGIGLATAKAFAREGAAVVIAGRSRERGGVALEEVRQLGGNARFVQTDVSQAGQVERLVSRTIEEYGPLDYAFNNATNIDVSAARFHETTERDFDHLVGVAFKGVWLCMQQEIRAMLAQGGGAIVNTSSVDALLPGPGTSLYAASKSAVIAMSKAVAKEYARDGIRVNVLCPGAFRTPMLESHAESPQDVPDLLARYSERIPMGRVGRPEEAAAAVLWLCSDAASYVTGHTLVVDGGIVGG
jgi:NAD(P)-dependent dehydrogenase (short-subunit alcohol dehydrogenase family)